MHDTNSKLTQLHREEHTALLTDMHMFEAQSGALLLVWYHYLDDSIIFLFKKLNKKTHKHTHTPHRRHKHNRKSRALWEYAHNEMWEGKQQQQQINNHNNNNNNNNSRKRISSSSRTSTQHTCMHVSMR